MTEQAQDIKDTNGKPNQEEKAEDTKDTKDTKDTNGGSLETFRIEQDEDGSGPPFPIQAFTNSVFSHEDLLSSVWMPREGVAMFIARVTPVKAAEILERFNEDNFRSIKKTYVEKYKIDMENDNWFGLLSPVAFDAEGNLKNGQHRMGSIVESGTTQELLIQWGLQEGAEEFFDHGASRTLYDIVFHRWGKNSSLTKQTTNRIAKVGKFMYLIRHEGVGEALARSKSNIPESVFVDYIEDNFDEIRDIVEFFWYNDHPEIDVSGIFGTNGLRILNKAGYIPYIMFAESYDTDTAQEFFYDLATAHGGFLQDLKNHIMNFHTATDTVAITHGEGAKKCYTYMVQAFNQWTGKEERQQYRWAGVNLAEIL